MTEEEGQLQEVAGQGSGQQGKESDEAEQEEVVSSPSTDVPSLDSPNSAEVVTPLRRKK